MFNPLRPVYNRFFRKEKALYKAVSGITGLQPDNIKLYRTALTHSSLSTQGELAKHHTNERLEFLGDAVLGTIIAEFLFQKFPYEHEGFLTEMRSRMVNRDALNQIAIKIGVSALVKSVPTRHFSAQKSIAGNALEALIGAVYLDKGYNKTKKFILEKIVKTHYDLHQLANTTTNFKSKLIEWAQSQNKVVRFETLNHIQTSSHSEFTVGVLIDDQPIGTGSGISKKRAEQAAAEKCLTELNLL